jgi:hypothetical protein
MKRVGRPTNTSFAFALITPSGELQPVDLPLQAIRSCHLIYLPKDGSTPNHHAYANYEVHWREFLHLLAAFAEKHGTPKSLDSRDTEIGRLKAELQASAAAEAGKALRAFAPPPRKRASKATQLALDIEAGALFPPANVVPLRPPADGIPDFLQRKKPAAPSLKPRVRLRADGSWSYVKGNGRPTSRYSKSWPRQ